MKSRFIVSGLVLLAFGIASAASADPRHGERNPKAWGHQEFPVKDHPGKGKGPGYNKPAGKSGKNFTGRGHVPELDPGGVGTAAILLAGGTLILIDRRRRARAS